jgi:uncharacterized membrane protein
VETVEAAPKTAPVAAKIVRPFAFSRQLVLLITMILSTIVCVMLFGYRVARTDSTVYASLNWNLFLAWVPVFFALIAYNVHRRAYCFGAVVAVVCATVWLAFFPNAPYLLTDLVHLRPREDMPYWFDQIMYLAYAWTGCYLGMVSLLFMQTVVRRSFGRIIGWFFALSVLVASGVGIYLGRFLRWNSWDLLLHPISIVRELVSWVIHPRSNAEAYQFSLFFSAFFAAVYLVLVAVLNLRKEETL